MDSNKTEPNFGNDGSGSQRAEAAAQFFEVKEFNPDRAENTRLLHKYWSCPDQKSLLFFKFLVIQGGNPTELPYPATLTEIFNKRYGPKYEKQIEEFETFLTEAKLVWNAEYNPPLPVAEEPLRIDSNKIIALSIAGGDRGSLSGALALRFVSNRVFGTEEIVKHVHWIAGASMGSVTALYLIKENNMKPSDCLKLFWSFHAKSEIPFASLSKTEKSSSLQYNFCQYFEKMTVKSRRARSERSDYVPKVCVTSIQVTPTPVEVVIHNNYGGRCLTELLANAAMASSADPKHFDPFMIEHGQYLFTSNGPSCNLPLGALHDEITEHSPDATIFALLSIETGNDLTVGQKIRWYGKAQYAIHGLLKPAHAHEIIEEFLEVAEIENDEMEVHIAQLTEAINGAGPHSCFTRLKPRPRTKLSRKDMGWQNYQISLMWDTLIYLSDPRMLTTIDLFKTAYKESQKVS